MKNIAFVLFLIFTIIVANSKTFPRFIVNGDFDYYVPPNEGCAIISTYLGICKLGMKHSHLRDVESTFMQIRKPPYSFLDITAVLGEYNVASKALKLRKKEDIFASNFTHFIIFLSNNDRNDIGHFSFCFRGKDGQYWIADPLYSVKCMEFTSESEIFKRFNGIVLILMKN